MSNDKLKDDILYAFAVEPEHDQKTLERYLRLHPEVTEELIELSFELRINAIVDSSEASPADAKANEAWQEFVACVPTAPRFQKNSNPFSQFRGEALVELANTLKMPRSILTSLRDRLPEPSSIPDRTIKRLAEAMAASIDAVTDYLLQPPGMVSTAQFKADKKPSQQGRVSFRELVDGTEMTDEQRGTILQDWDDDRPSRG